MKLSFSIQNWDSLSWGEACSAAAEACLSGIELYDMDAPMLQGKNSPVNPELAAVTRRSLVQDHLSVSCLCTVGDFTAPNFAAELREVMEVAVNLGTESIAIHTGNTDEEACAVALSRLLELVGEQPVILLVETTGAYADTKRLRDLLNRYADDRLCACWNVHDTCYAGEGAEETITNLGAYVRHVHIHDYRLDNGVVLPELLGEGDLPIADFMDALRSVNYDGFISLLWNPAWMEGLEDIEIILTHFVNCMGRFESTRLSRRHLWWNKAHTGNYVWKQGELIDKTFPQVLDTMVEEFPDQIAIRYTTLDYTRTYRQFQEDVDEFARALISLGVRPGSKVTIWATNVPQWFLTFWATTKIGAILVTMNTAYKIHEAEYLLRQSDTHTLVMIEGYRDSNYREIIHEICPELKNNKPGSPLHAKRLPFLRNVITVGFRQEGSLTWEEALEYAAKTPLAEVHRRASAVDINDVCNMQYTSGTTGFPKGVMLTHYNVVNDGKSIGDGMDLSTADRMMIQVPMFHCFGMVLAMTATMTHGGTILPIPYFSPKSSLACIHNEHITAFHGVPTMFIAMLSHPDFPKTDFSYMRTGIMAGSPCPIAVMRDVVEKMHMPEIVIVYGQTEASPGCTMSRTTDPLEVRVATVGSAFPEVECKIVDPETGEDCPDEVIGEFVARGYNIMKGYYKMPKATAAAIDKDGWLNTGDLGIMSHDNEIKITGRAKDTIVLLDGENIEPSVIEGALLASDFIESVMVTGQDKKYLGALIVPSKDNLVLYAEENGIPHDNYEELLKNEKIHSFFEKIISQIITSANGFRICEKIYKFALIPKSFEAGVELSAKLEMMRYKIAEMYKKEIDALFE